MITYTVLRVYRYYYSYSLIYPQNPILIIEAAPAFAPISSCCFVRFCAVLFGRFLLLVLEFYGLRASSTPNLQSKAQQQKSP